MRLQAYTEDPFEICLHITTGIFNKPPTVHLQKKKKKPMEKKVELKKKKSV